MFYPATNTKTGFIKALKMLQLISFDKIKGTYVLEYDIRGTAKETFLMELAQCKACIPLNFLVIPMDLSKSKL
jgi:hypothetical protein